MAGINVYILLLCLLPASVLPDFAARKLCHAGCGFGIMCLDSSELLDCSFVWVVAASSIAMAWIPTLPQFRFARPRDVGITAYLLLVSLWFGAGLPSPLLAPLFFADPAGAVVGKLVTHHAPSLNPIWYSNKTVCGTLAVVAVTYGTVPFSEPAALRLSVALLAGAAEAVGGEYDNVALGAVVVLGWQISEWSSASS